ncbi:uncharacterized protein [Primulina eburnea]|uniref:uncharacterized protein isoform X1 n=1 Tax=Primulina eburnea TaxID=1245227 RepID=UPI003C6C31B4
MYAYRRLLLLLAVALFYAHRDVYCRVSGGGVEVQWQILSKFNYSSYIRLHPHALLMVTVPWSGESRSLMMELAHAVAREHLRFNTLKLMVLYRNTERILADSLGASHGITIIYHHDAFPYKYRGRLRVQSILSSVHYVMTLSPEELPLKSLTSPEGLNDFLESTDKAVLLLEFCGWIPRLLAKSNIKAESELGDLGTDDGVTSSEENNDGKVIVDDKLNLGIDSGFSGFSWLSQFTSVNDSLMKEAENFTFRSGASCSEDEFQHFKLFLKKFIVVAREFFIPHERHRFALVNDKSLLPSLKVEESNSWLTAVYFSGCPSCSKVLREGDELRTLLQQPLPVVELEDDFGVAEATLPAKRPSALLFVDRSSDSMQIKIECQRALNAFREFVQHYEISNNIHGLATVQPGKSTTDSKRASWSTLKRPFVRDFSESQTLVLKDKMSVMIKKDGKQLTLEDLLSDLQGSSMHEMLTYALNRKKEIKLSSVAKDAGFQLLSTDFDVKVVESLPSTSEVQPDLISGETLGESIIKDTIDKDKNQISAISSNGQHEELSDPSCTEHVSLEGNEGCLDKSSQSSIISEDIRRLTSIAPDSVHNGGVEETRLLEIDDTIQQKYFGISFFFIDGETRFLETLTGQSKIPAVVIIDPIAEKHYVLAKQSIFNYSMLSDFVNNFLRGKLAPYQQSVPTVPSPIESPRPPFVNLDYHEKESIPLLTARTFAKLILGNKSDTENSDSSWDRNILVLFSNSWCGFCQRMELVVRELHRAIKGYAKLKANGSRMEKLTLTEFADDATLRLPLIYMMDCSLNDCGSIIIPILQRELYPLLLLFPAERKKDPVPYEGDIAVCDIINFLAGHGSHVHDLIMDKSYRQLHTSAEGVHQDKSLPHEVLVNGRFQNLELKTMNSRFPIGLHERPQLSIGCILSATEKLLDVHPFEESKILLVKAEQRTGFQGLIFNKRISWDSLEEEGFDLLKEAPLSFGGPVLRSGLPLVALTHKFIENLSVEILQEVYFLDQWATQSAIEEIRVGNQSVHDYWFFFGYSSWGWDQLFHEIAQGAWNIKNGSLEQLELPWT